MLVQNNFQLKQFSQECQKDKIIGVDTEFFWTNTYTPVPCLIQIANKKKIILIDLIKSNLNLEPIKNLLKNENILKVFHSARQDYEVFFNLFNETPNNIFDTQIALTALSTYDSISLRKMYFDFLNVNISKEDRNFDWRKRPLLISQIKYAINDVKFLVQSYKIILKKLKKLNRLHWVLELQKKILNKDIFKKKPKIAWKKIKFKAIYKNELFLIKKISEFREIEAQKSNKLSKNILTNTNIIKLSKKNINKSTKLQIIKKINNENLKKKLRSLLNKPLLFKIKINYENNCPELKIKIKKARILLNEISNELNINPSIIANKKDLENIFLEKNNEFFQGWKYQIFGKRLKEIKLI